MKKVLFPVLLLITFFSIQAQDPKGQTVLNFIAPTDSLDNYYTHDDYFGKVGFRIVKTILQRDLLPLSRRQEGMKVYVLDDNKTYRLLDCIGNNCWVQDRIDTLWNGTFSTGKITVQPTVDGSTFLFDAYTADGYQRFGVTKSGLLLSGRRMPLAVNVDGLVFIGDRNEMLATDGIAIGKDLIVNGDTAAAFGYNLESNKYNSLIIGRGANRANRVKSRWMRSVNIGAFQTIPQIELTEDTIRLNSTVLWWNGAPIVGGSGSLDSSDLVTKYDLASGNISNNFNYYSFDGNSNITMYNDYIDIGNYNTTENGIYIDNTGIGLRTENSNNSYNSRIILRNDKDSPGITLQSTSDLSGTTKSAYLFIDTTGLLIDADTSLFTDNSAITKKYFLDRVNSGSVLETDPIFDVSPAKNITEANISAWNSKQAALVSGSNIKTIKGQSLLGPGDIPINMQYQKTLDSSLQWKKQFSREFKIYDDEDGMIYFSSQSGYSNILFTTGQSGYGAPTSDINMTRGQVYISAGPSTNNQAITLTQDGARYYKRQTMNNPSWIPDKAYTDSLTANLIPAGTSNQYVAGDKTLKDFPVKTMVVNIPNANLRTSGTGSRIELLSYMPQNSIVLGATIRFSKFESGSTRLSASIGSSATYPILILTNVEPESVGYNFIPNTTRYGGNVLYFEVTSTNITDTEMTGTLSFAYIPLGL